MKTKWLLKTTGNKNKNKIQSIKYSTFPWGKWTCKWRFHSIPLPTGWGTEKPGILNRDPEQAWLGLISEYPEVVRVPISRTRFLRACWDSSPSSLSNLHNQYKLWTISYQFITLKLYLLLHCMHWHGIKDLPLLSLI